MEDGNIPLTKEESYQPLDHSVSLFKGILEYMKEAIQEKWSSSINGEHIAIGVEKLRGFER